jgi:indole-3-glycerol phosphate synthase
MSENVPDILARIVGRKQAALDAVRQRRADLERLAAETVASRRDFHQALATGAPAIISEIKKASPSKGLLAESFDPPEIARAYQAGGASALSVLTDEEFFQGKLDDLVAARAAVTLPVLRKDFTIDPVHVIEAAARGADAILLIAAILTEAQMREYRELAASFKMAALVEVHNAAELDVALASGAEIVGVNNRNLHTFDVTLDTSLQLVAKMPENVIKVSESGIHSADDVHRLREAGFHAFLVGEHLMKSGNPTESLRALRS